VLIHCAAGKDRTGIAAGLLLEMLGVERAFILADYAKTEQLLDWDRLTAAAAVVGARPSLPVSEPGR
jgi:protein-tyrosine phosphatase